MDPFNDQVPKLKMKATSFVRKTLGIETPEPPVARPPGETPTTFAKKPKLAGDKSRKRDIPEGSEEWDLLQRRYYAEELKKLGIDLAK